MYRILFSCRINDPKHTALNIRIWLVYNTPKELKTLPQSPYKNPIEHLRDELDRNITRRVATNKKGSKTSWKYAS